ncbi:MAG: peptidoglycan-binding protein [Candidatus Liptonbacteria bacterium]|nr:peptidoglycan-binding protein [Candidatus Liptonbacteria bacterium]
MSKRFLFPKVVLFLALIGVFGVPRVYAAVPILSLASAGGDSAQISVTGDPNAGVMFYYNVGTGSGAFSTALGSTNANGSFGVTLSASSYAINTGGSVYVIVNGQQSSVQAWPTSGAAASTATPTGAPTFSQSSVTIGVGQSTTVISQGSATGVYLLVNSLPTIATVFANGTQVTVTGNQIGSSSATLCYVGTASSCTIVSISVQAASVATVSFSQNNITLSSGQTLPITVSGGTGNYAITSNSNPTVVQATLSSSTVTLYAPATSGTAVVTVCSSGTSSCGTLSVSVSASAAAASQSLVVFGAANPPVTVGQDTPVTVSGASGKYTIGNNPSPNLVKASLNAGTLTLTGVAPGSAFVTVCDASNSNNCATVFFTVINGPAAAPPVAAPAPAAPVAPVPVPTPAAPAPVVAAAPQTASTNAEVLAVLQSMQSKLLQLVAEIQTMQNTLLQLVAKVTASAPNVPVAAQTVGYQFMYDLSLGSNGDDVTALQNRLTRTGFYSGPVTGFYGSLTKEGVTRYQTAHSLPALGTLDMSTRVMLNAGL